LQALLVGFTAFFRYSMQWAEFVGEADVETTGQLAAGKCFKRYASLSIEVFVGRG